MLPWNCNSQGVCNGYIGAPQSADYVYGFRVPLLVVGAYTHQTCTYNSNPNCYGYISGTAAQGGEKPPYVHDFGSILNFVEYVFGLGEISPNYHYADFWAPDGPNNPNCGGCIYSLSDFFNFGSQHPFTPILGAKYPTNYFYSSNPGQYFPTYPSDPDDDLIDPQ